MSRTNGQALFVILSLLAAVIYWWGKHVNSLSPDRQDGGSKKGVVVIRGPNRDEQREQVLSHAVEATSRALSQSILDPVTNRLTGTNSQLLSSSSVYENNVTQEDEGIFNGKVRPPLIPPDWKGEPLPDKGGWRWYSPTNRLDSVRIYRGDSKSSDPSKRLPYVVVTRNGELIDRFGTPTGTYLKD
jgi:hypothetical protein